MENALELSIAEDLDGVPNVHDDGVGNTFSGHPLALVKELEARNHVVENESECTYIGVSFDTESEFWLWTLGVVIDFHLKKKLFNATNFLL